MSYARFSSTLNGQPFRSLRFPTVGGVAASVLVLAMTMMLPNGGVAQTPTGTTAPAETVKEGYSVHQTADLGGHIASIKGSGAMYDTLVNIHSGPRILGETYDMHAVPNSRHLIFDTLSAFGSGFGGDPNNVATLRFSKGKSYDFQGLFRRDRQYFDYNLLGNPLVPSGLVSNGYTFPQLIDSPHMFNTVRRMTDLNLTILPISKITFRTGYSQNISQGPTLSSIHEGADALLLQNWRNSTDTFLAGLDWKPLTQTRLTFQETITHYKGDTNYQLAPSSLNLQLANGTPVSLGYDNVTVPGNSSASSPCGSKPPILNGTTNPPTANSCINGYLQYSRYEPMRTIFPTEEVRFQSSSIPRIHMNGRFGYTGASMNQPNYFESFAGLLTRLQIEALTVTGYAKAQRVNVAGDFGVLFQLTNKISLSEQYDYSYFRQPGLNIATEIDQKGTSMIAVPGAPQPAVVSSSFTYLSQKVQTNLVTAAWDASSRATISLGYRYRNRTIVHLAVGDEKPGDVIPIHENGGILNVDLRPSTQWRINGAIEAIYDDNAYVQPNPRQTQHYRLRAAYKPKDWATVSAAFNDLERRDNVYLVNHLDHSRSLTFGATLAPNEHYGLDLNYGYTDVYSQTTECYYSSLGGTPVPDGTACGTNTLLGNFYYDAPTQYGAFSIMLAPVKAVRSNIGYRISGVNGNTVYYNPRQVPGALQSQYMSPYANIAYTVHPGWIWKGDWNYYGYGEDGAIGPTSPRAFHSNVITIAMHYEF